LRHYFQAIRTSGQVGRDEQHQITGIVYHDILIGKFIFRSVIDIFKINAYRRVVADHFDIRAFDLSIAVTSKSIVSGFGLHVDNLKDIYQVRLFAKYLHFRILKLLSDFDALNSRYIEAVFSESDFFAEKYADDNHTKIYQSRVHIPASRNHTIETRDNIHYRFTLQFNTFLNDGVYQTILINLTRRRHILFHLLRFIRFNKV
jgi:hypothetical protein